VELNVVANFAWQHFKAATYFRDQLMQLEAQHASESRGNFVQDIRACASACIMSTAAGLEALINELFIAPSPAGGLRSRIPDFETEFWGRDGIEFEPILKKYQYALKLLNQAPFDEADSPYVDARSVIALRNALVHFKPTWDSQRRQQVDLSACLAGKFDPGPFTSDTNNFVTDKCMCSACATWVINSAMAFVSTFTNRAVIERDKIDHILRLQ
jgi:hypothetical protein